MIIDFGRGLNFVPSPLQACMPIFLNHEENILFQYLIGRSNRDKLSSIARQSEIRRRSPSDFRPPEYSKINDSNPMPWE